MTRSLYLFLFELLTLLFAATAADSADDLVGSIRCIPEGTCGGSVVVSGEATDRVLKKSKGKGGMGMSRNKSKSKSKSKSSSSSSSSSSSNSKSRSRGKPRTVSRNESSSSSREHSRGKGKSRSNRDERGGGKGQYIEWDNGYFYSGKGEKDPMPTLQPLEMPKSVPKHPTFDPARFHTSTPETARPKVVATSSPSHKPTTSPRPPTPSPTSSPTQVLSQNPTMQPVEACRCDDEKNCSFQPIPRNVAINLCIFAQGSLELIGIDQLDLVYAERATEIVSPNQGNSTGLLRSCSGSVCVVNFIVPTTVYDTALPGDVSAAGFALAELYEQSRPITFLMYFSANLLLDDIESGASEGLRKGMSSDARDHLESPQRQGFVVTYKVAGLGFSIALFAVTLLFRK